MRARLLTLSLIAATALTAGCTRIRNNMGYIVDPVLVAAVQPGVDVCVFQRDAADALLAGRNPYAITFPDPYGPARGLYGEGVVKDGRTTWGYPSARATSRTGAGCWRPVRSCSSRWRATSPGWSMSA